MPIPPSAPAPDAGQPAPTPTREGNLAAIGSLARFAADMADRFALQWDQRAGPGEEAVLLETHGRRMAALCRGTGLVPWRDDTAAVIGPIRDAVRLRHEWVSNAAAELTCCGTGRSPELDAAEQETRSALARVLADLPSGADTARTWSALDLGVTLSVPPGWVLVRSDFELVLLAPAALQRVGPEALGPSPRPNGSAVRMWSVALPGPYSLSDALRDS
ncbi:MAG: hypothetical protein FJ313_04395, partial [Gemmatimonadetes bacterium]|nr:hypothetical protein [Gemmatimonadota bacterium]